MNCCNLQWCPYHPGEFQREARMGPAWMRAEPGTFNEELNGAEED